MLKYILAEVYIVIYNNNKNILDVVKEILPARIRRTTDHETLKTSCLSTWGLYGRQLINPLFIIIAIYCKLISNIIKEILFF